MIDIQDKAYAPSAAEIGELIGGSVFDELCRVMDDQYQALRKIEYSSCSALPGWNLKFRKAGRGLCTVYPRDGHFLLMVIVGRKEQEWVETLLPTFSPEFHALYESTQACMDQRWLVADFSQRSALFDDMLAVIRIRRQSK